MQIEFFPIRTFGPLGSWAEEEDAEQLLRWRARGVLFIKKLSKACFIITREGDGMCVKVELQHLALHQDTHTLSQPGREPACPSLTSCRRPGSVPVGRPTRPAAAEQRQRRRGCSCLRSVRRGVVAGAS